LETVKNMTEEEEELARVTKYFDLVDTVTADIIEKFKKSDIIILDKYDWKIIREHMLGLAELASNYMDLFKN